MVTPARRIPPRGGNTAPSSRAPTQTVRSTYSGAEGLRKAQEVEERDAARREAQQLNQGQPFRFYCPPRESREIIVIDDKPDFFRFEHNMKNPRTNKWDIFCACINENANCPACKVLDRPSYYALFLTVIDLTPYETKDGVNVPWSKKLLVAKTQQYKKIVRLYERHGTLRGMLLQVTRDSEKDANIGNDIEFVEFVPESDLEQYVDEYTDKKGKTHEILGFEPYDYFKLFPDPTEQQIRAVVGARPEPGSRDEEDEENIGKGKDDGWKSNVTTRRNTRQNVEEEPAAQEVPARLGTSRRVTATVESNEDEIQKTQEVEQDPIRASRAPLSSSRRAVRQEEPEQEQTMERPSMSSLAARRAALRRG